MIRIPKQGLFQDSDSAGVWCLLNLWWCHQKLSPKERRKGGIGREVGRKEGRKGGRKEEKEGRKERTNERTVENERTNERTHVGRNEPSRRAKRKAEGM